MSLTPIVLLLVGMVLTLAEDPHLGCQSIKYDDDGSVRVDATLAQCAAQMSAPSMPVSYNKEFKGNLTVSNQLSLNNIINVNEVDSVIELDFYYRQSWTDPRWHLNQSFWDGLEYRVQLNGMEIYELYSGDHREDAIPVWVPDAFFQDVMEMEVQARTLKLYPEGGLFYSRHCRLVLKQAHMNLEKYPLDAQWIDLKLLSYGLTAQHMKMVYKDPPIEYLLDADGNINFGNNAIWEHKAGYYNASIKVDDFVINDYLKTYETLHMKIYIERQGTGVLMRFAMPILILLLLAGLTFWANFETRIDTTMTILLSVSALYVVILGSIPQVGYLTDFDKWIFRMFVMLALCVFSHQVVVNSFRKVETWPFRAVVIRLIELLGRSLVMPLSFAFFISTFEGPEIESFTKIYVELPLLLFFFLIMVRECFGVRKSINQNMEKICEKIEKKKKAMSWWELFSVNLYYFNVIDFTTAPYEAKMKRMKRTRAGQDGTINEMHSITGAEYRNSDTIERPPDLLRRKSLYDSDDEL